MRSGRFPGASIATVLAIVVVVALPARLSAEPVIDQILSGVRISENAVCASMRIDFNVRIAYDSHFPVRQGDELRIKFRLIDQGAARRETQTSVESVRAPQSERAAVRAIEFEGNKGTSLALTIYFKHHVFYKVAQGTDFTSIVVAVAGEKPSDRCPALFPREGAGERSTRLDSATTDQSAGPARRRRPRRNLPDVPLTDPKTADRSKQISAADRERVEKLIEQARSALTRENFRRAVQLLTKMLSFAENAYSREAQELLGLARERKGQLAHAKAEYEEYLRRYPSGPGARRVKQRLAGLLTAAEQPKKKLRKAKAALSEQGEEDAWRWGVSGSFSQFYFRNEGFREFEELTGTTKDQQLFQNSLLHSVDLIATFGNEFYDGTLRFSGFYENEFTEFGHDGGTISSLYYESNFSEWDVHTRFGRQTRNTGGVLGRFDGGLVSWQAMPEVQLNVVGGSPVDRSRDAPLKYDRYFYGVSLDFGQFQNTWDTSIYFIDQWIDGLIDRRALGAEFRYFDANKSVFTTVDYDLHFLDLGTAILSGSYVFPDKSTVNAYFDYRHSPLLLTTNALQGQGVESIADLLSVFTESEIKQLAEDRTAKTWSATLGFSRPINEMFQFSIDGTVTDTSSTEASGGVPAIPSTGLEYFLSGQIVGTNMIKDGDIYVVGLRYADTFSSNLLLLDAYSRFPVDDSLRVRPRLRLGYRFSSERELEEYLISPSVRANYHLGRNWSFEVDVGAKWISRQQFGLSEREWEYFVTLGYRYDFQYGER